MRVTVLILGILVLLIGFSQLILGDWWIAKTRSLIEFSPSRWLGLITVLIGLILFIAADAKAIGMRDVMSLMGILFIVLGVYYVLNPGFWNKYTEDVFLNQPPDVQTRFLVITGLIRITFGVAMIYAATQRPRRRDTLREVR